MLLTCPTQHLGLGHIRRGHNQDSRPKGYPKPYDATLSNNPGGRLAVNCSSGTGWAQVCWWWAIVLICITCLFWVLFISLLILFSLIKKKYLLQLFYFNYWTVLMSFLTFTFAILLPHHTGGGNWASGCFGAQLLVVKLEPLGDSGILCLSHLLAFLKAKPL